MTADGSNKVVLHIEEDPSLVLLVKLAFKDLGFQGELTSVGSVKDALALIKARENRPVNLILLDMELPDGTGLDVIRAVKTNIRWRLTPVLILSNQLEREVIDAAYALGASCFLPKMPPTGAVLENLQSLYHCWLEAVVFPRTPKIDRMQEAVGRGSNLRARTAEFCLAAARSCKETSDVSFWLDRALSEGNLSNLLAFLQPIVNEGCLPVDLADRFIAMQDKVELSLQRVERLYGGIRPNAISELCSAAMDLLSGVDESVMVELLNCLFTLTPQAISSFRKYAAAHMEALCKYTLENTDDERLHDRVKKLHTLADHMA